MPRIDDLLAIMLEHGASDLHLSAGSAPYLRLHGDMTVLEGQPKLTTDATRAMLLEIMPPKSLAEFEVDWDTDFAYELPGRARFRVNVFVDREGVGGVLRQIPSKVPTADQLGLPKAVRDFCYLTKGLVVVTGPTGSGKSTTLAALIDLINRTRTDHVITIEDPIEFVHTPKRCLFNQREVHSHTKSFANALRAALREDPDIVLLGEMRDLETMEIALETAETGHLVFGTLHTNTAASTVETIVNKFPADRQNQVRTLLADCLKGVVAQTLCRRKTGGRVAAMEILIVTPGIASNIRDGKAHYIPSSMQVGKNLGMVLVEDALLSLVASEIITPQEAFLRAIDKPVMRRKLQDAGVAIDAALESDAAAAASLAVSVPRTPEEQLQDARDALGRDPNDVAALIVAAWVLSTHPADSVRSGSDAVQAAEKALMSCRREQTVAVLEALAAAYAELGRFAEAVEAARKSVELAGAESADVRRLQAALAEYEAGRPFRET